MNENEDKNLIIEVNSDNEDTLFEDEQIQTEQADEETLVVTKKKKNKKEFFYKRLSKKGKIVFWISLFLVFLIIGAVIFYFIIFNKPEKEEEKESIVIQSENYTYKDGVLHLMNNNKKEIGTYTCVNKEAEKCFVAKLSNEDNFDLPLYQDKEGNEIEQISKIYNNKYVFIYDNEKISLYDIDTQKATGEYELIKVGNTTKDYVVAKDSEGNYGVLTIGLTSADILVDFSYDYLGIISSNETFVAKEGAYSYLIDTSGKSLTAKIKGEVKNFTEKYLSVYENNYYYLYDYKGSVVSDKEYDYIDFLNNYIFLVSESKLYAYNDQLIKLNENGIKLRTDDYQIVYTFDETNALSKTEKPYEITINEGDIKVAVNETINKTINIYEGLLSSKTKYINYFEGTLYFYSDEKKTELIGSYTCKNENQVTSSTMEFTDCFVAQDENILNGESTGYIPIINNSYVFIKDSKTGSINNSIILYDLRNSSQKVKYQGVDTGLGTSDISHKSGSGITIAAKNTDGNLGLISFKESGPTGLISFKEGSEATKKISFLGDYYYVERTSKNYLYSKSGELLASSTFIITEYKNPYLIVKNGIKYKLYKLVTPDNGEIISEEFDFIKVFDNYYVGINNNAFNIYKFSSPQVAVLKENVKLLTEDSKYSNFEIYTSPTNYLIKLKQSDGSILEQKYGLDGSLVE